MSDSVDVPKHPDHDAEQAYVHAAREALLGMQERAAATLEFGDRAVAEENTVEARIARAHLRDRTESLQLGDTTLAFGRIDEDPLLADGDTWYVGRRHIENEDTEPVVVDWRVPVAIPFYRATAADPQGLALRRRFTLSGDELVALFDENLDDPESVVGAGLPDPLLAEVEKSRTGEMSDIVATIAAEQDEIIRAPLAECLIVQGGPGTGKTAVGLHRAAFLLFEHRIELSTDRVLVVGPNKMFLRYVGNVLPSLGETAVSQATVQSLLDVKYRVRGEDSPAAHILKGELRMAEVIRAAALDKLKLPTEPTRLPVGARSVVLTPEQVASAQTAALARSVPLNSARSIFSQVLLREAKQNLADLGMDEPAIDAGIDSLRRGDDLKKLVARCWPNLGATTLVQSILSNAALLKRVTAQTLTDDERSLLHRKAPSKGADPEWTLADLALLDEANALCAGVSLEYGHVVVDEAQDLSSMALRVVGRRARKGSITILGDIAQATAPGAQESWDDVVEALGVDPEQTSVRQSELTVGYRVPGPLLDFANQLLPVTAPDITPSTSVRHGGPGPAVVSVGIDELAAAVVGSVGELSSEFQTTGVIVPTPLFGDVFAALVDAGLDPVDTTRSQTLGAALSVVDASVAKGLEFDAVVVVEPGDFPALHADELTGLRLLYIALTRAVQRLTIVHTTPFPPALQLLASNPS
jgi:DNA helicase IV